MIDGLPWPPLGILFGELFDSVGQGTDVGDKTRTIALRMFLVGLAAAVNDRTKQRLLWIRFRNPNSMVSQSGCRAVVVIAHRLSRVVHADKIVVKALQCGRPRLIAINEFLAA